MTCPSRHAERYLAAQELPETCPACGRDNADPDTGDWLCDQAAPYCSEGCVDWESEQRQERREADRLARDLADEESLGRGWRRGGYL